MKSHTATVGVLILGLTFSACSTQVFEEDPDALLPNPGETDETLQNIPERETKATENDAENEQENDIVNTVVSFTAGSTVVEVTIHDDTPTTQDFLSMLPMTLHFEDYAQMEKIAYPERDFDYTDAEGMTPEVGDLFSYIPWGNLGFFYDTGNLGFSNQLVRIGTTEDLEAVMELDGQDVTIDIVQ